MARTSSFAIAIVLLTGMLAAPRPAAARLSWVTEARARVIVRFKNGPELRSTNRAEFVNALQQEAAAAQADALAWLQPRQAAGEAGPVQSLWIINGLAISATAGVIAALAERPDVLSVSEDTLRRYFDPGDTAVMSDTLETPLALDAGPPTAGEAPWGLRKIGADQAQLGLGISGAGVVVANIDSGVDWNHPSLRERYRGFGNGVAVDHLHNWFDATGDGADYPSDSAGHGTHTMGTMVAGDTGVAPGAQWIAARALNNLGFGLNSWFHLAFQFMLAPGGDPALAPDIVSNSWGDNNGLNIEFRDDVRALNRAGIAVFFSAGNRGPRPGTVGSPASLPEAIAIGATDEDDSIASFSSRGPSPINGALKPQLMAPGVGVLSTLPGGAYGIFNGTSMAAPHVAGVAALLLSARPGMSQDALLSTLIHTAVPLSDTLPNNVSGYGRINAFAAVLSVISTGALSGTVRDGASPVAGATVTATDSVNQRALVTMSAADGSYAFQPLPGIYSVSAGMFGYISAQSAPRVVALNTAARVDLNMAILPSGSVRGTVRDAATAGYVTAQVRALDTPKLSLSNNNCLPCRYALDLPAGSYVLEARAIGYRVTTQTVTIVDGQLADVNFDLLPTLKIALVDSGRWYFASSAPYYRAAFERLGLVADEFVIKNPPFDTPTITNLLKYDALVWSAPADAPSLVAASGVLSNYLSSGRRMILTGQDVAFYDGGGIGLQHYFFNMVNTSFVADDADSSRVAGVAGPLNGVTLTLDHGDGADDLRAADIVTPTSADFGAPIASYVQISGSLLPGAATFTTPCSRYRAAYFGFGLEAIDSVSARAAVLDRTLTAFDAPKPEFGLEVRNLDHVATGAVIGLPGEQLIHAVRVRNTGAGGITQTYTIAPGGNIWPVKLSATTVTLAPCASAIISATVQIPGDAARDARDPLTLRVSLPAGGLAQSIALEHKTAGALLLVDDDRFFPSEQPYLTALAAVGNHADRWDASNDTGVTATPTITVLRRYPMVIWQNGYDWFDPLNPDDETLIRDYLAGGGRIFLASQAALGYTGRSQLMREYFGVASIDYEDVLSNVLSMEGSALGEGLRSGSALPFPYNWNLSSAVQPMPGAEVFARGDSFQPFGLLQLGTNWRTAFMPLAFEALPAATQADLLNRIVAWLAAPEYCALIANGAQPPCGTGPARPIPAGPVFTIAPAEIRWGGQVTVTVTQLNASGPITIVIPTGLTLVGDSAKISGASVREFRNTLLLMPSAPGVAIQARYVLQIPSFSLDQPPAFYHVWLSNGPSGIDQRGIWLTPFTPRNYFPIMGR